MGKSAGVAEEGTGTCRTEASRGRVFDCAAVIACKQAQQAPHTLSSAAHAMMLLTHHCSAATVNVVAPPPPNAAIMLGGTEESEEHPYVQ